MLKHTIAIVAFSLVSLSFAQDGVIRPRSQNEIPGNRPIDAMRAEKQMQEASTLISKARMTIDRVLPIYAGRAHRAKYLAQFSYDDLNKVLQYQKPEVSGARPVRNNTNSDLRTRIRNIPATKDKNRRDYPGDLGRTSDEQLRNAGRMLVQAQQKLWRIDDKFGGHLNDARTSLEMAIGEIERSVGIARLPERRSDLGKSRTNKEIDGVPFQ